MEATPEILPPALAAMLQLTSLTEVHVGMSGDRVFRCRSVAGTRLYLKISYAGLHSELARLLWLQGRLPVPEVAYFSEYERRHFLLLTEVPGVVSHDESLRPRLDLVIRRYAEALQLIHAVSAQSCPFDETLSVKVSAAQARVQAGRVDESDFEAEHQGMSAEALFAALQERLPSQPEDLVFTHGDYCMPNVLLDPDTLALTGLVDWGRAGVADRYQDLGLATRSIEYNFGPQWVNPFQQAYGLDQADDEKVAFYRLLDELF